MAAAVLGGAAVAGQAATTQNVRGEPSLCAGDRYRETGQHDGCAC